MGLGLGTGLVAASLLVTMIEFTTEARAGVLLGVWGVAHLLGRAAASLMGGAIVDVMMSVTTQNAVVSYGTAFVLEAVLLVTAAVLISRVDLDEARISITTIDMTPKLAPAATD